MMAMMIEQHFIIKYRDGSESGNCKGSFVGMILYSLVSNEIYVNVPLSEGEFEWVKEKFLEYYNGENKSMTVFNRDVKSDLGLVVQLSF